MTRRTEVDQRVERLREISGVMTAMKNLALVETRKLARFVGHQQQVLARIEAVASDFLHFFPMEMPAVPERAIVVVIGSERGFCGNFNDRLLSALHDLPPTPPPRVLVVGRRLATKLAGHPLVAATLDGPAVAEEVPGVLSHLMDALHEARQDLDGRVALLALAHTPGGDPEVRRLLPMAPPEAPRFTHPPRLQLAPAELLAHLVEHYLVAALDGLFYGSLAAENQRRMEHMDHALHRLDELLAGLTLKRRALRQEEIVEEIEVIMLSSELLQSSLGPAADKR
jgi:F-type H+-transporting ATPase subunit gamma